MPTQTPGAAARTPFPGEIKFGEEVASVESGTISSFQDAVALEPWRHRADTSRRLAYLLAGLLSAAFFGHFGATVAFIFMGKLEASALKDIFALWLPVLSALTGTAIAFYFRQQHR